VNQQDAMAIVPAVLASRGTSPMTGRFQLFTAGRNQGTRRKGAARQLLESIRPRRDMT
jgi:hypothetical protein